MLAKKMHYFLWLLSFFYSQAGLATAESIDFLGMPIPKYITLEQSQEKVYLQGYSLREINANPFYIAAFFTSKPEKREQMLLLADISMTMVYYFIQDNINADIVKEIFTESFLLNSPDWDSQAVNKNRFLELQKMIYKTIKTGDVLRFEYSSKNDQLTVIINSTVLKTWENGRSLFNAILRTWIGPYPPSRDFKKAILTN